MSGGVISVLNFSKIQVRSRIFKSADETRCRSSVPLVVSGVCLLMTCDRIADFCPARKSETSICRKRADAAQDEPDGFTHSHEKGLDADECTFRGSRTHFLGWRFPV